MGFRIGLLTERRKDNLETGICNKKMGVVRTNIGNVEVLIETVETEMQEAFPGMTDTADRNTVSDKIYDAFESAKDVIQGIVREFSGINALGVNSPDETKISFSMSLAAEGNLWLIKSGSNMTLNVEMTWKQSER